MKTSGNRRILIAFDGSFHANEATRYIGSIPRFRHMEIVLFHVFQKIPECYYDMENATPMASRMKEIHAWEAQQEHDMEDALTKARQCLVDAGVPEANIRVELRERKKGIARDIAAEARQGYAAIVVGRKGVRRIRELVMGSVSAKLLERLTYVPIIIVGRASNAERILLAVDRSEGAMRAVSFAARALADSTCDMTLAHVTRGNAGDCLEEARDIMNEALDKAVARMMRAGVARERIATRMISGAQSRAAVLVQKASQGKFGTIVVGRRGLSRVREFFIGRVSNKVIQLVRDQAVWVVS